ncbi:MAG: cyclase family protein [Bacteroidia bacterium]|nr:cyclase family protein [Bacteroidia bacterium]
MDGSFCAWIDVSVPLSSETPVWTGDPSPVMTALACHEAGDRYHLSEIFMGLHSGTHIDAPLHFIPGGKDISQIPLSKLCARVRVLDASREHSITENWLKNKNIQEGEGLLFKTLSPSEGARQMPSPEEMIALDASAAVYLVSKKIQVAGTDSLSIAGLGDLEKVHVSLLENEVLIIEHLQLQGVEEGTYELMALPIKIKGAEAAPARVLLRRVV